MVEHTTSTVFRLLQNGNNQTDSQPDVYEFLGFVAWYLFLVVCCIIPTACAYRRRQILTRRQLQLQAEQRQTMAAAQAYFSNFGFPPHQMMMMQDPPPTDEEQIRDIQEALLKTTMKVEASNLVKRNEQDETLNSQPIEPHDHSNETPNENDENEETDYKKVTTVVLDEEMGGMASIQEELYLDESETEFSHLELPADAPNGGRSVPAACAICLCPYEVQDEVAWSPESACLHAFHKDCIVSWLTKKSQRLCPCCRQTFCHVVVVTPLSPPRAEQGSGGSVHDGSPVPATTMSDGMPYGATYPPPIHMPGY